MATDRMYVRSVGKATFSVRGGVEDKREVVLGDYARDTREYGEPGFFPY